MKFPDEIKSPRKLWALLVLVVLFDLACFKAIFMSWFFWALPKTSQRRRVVVAADRLIAADLGYSGKWTLSSELAFSERHKVLRNLIYTVNPKHCEQEAIDEHMYCRIYRKDLGEK